MQLNISGIIGAYEEVPNVHLHLSNSPANYDRYPDPNRVFARHDSKRGSSRIELYTIKDVARIHRDDAFSIGTGTLKPLYGTTDSIIDGVRYILTAPCFVAEYDKETGKVNFSSPSHATTSQIEQAMLNAFKGMVSYKDSGTEVQYKTFYTQFLRVQSSEPICDKNRIADTRRRLKKAIFAKGQRVTTHSTGRHTMIAVVQDHVTSPTRLLEYDANRLKLTMSSVTIEHIFMLDNSGGHVMTKLHENYYNRIGKDYNESDMVYDTLRFFQRKTKGNGNLISRFDLEED